MINTDEDALICDLAETYRIFDYKSLPLSTVATLSVGLRDDSRIKMKMRGVQHALDTVLMAAVADRLSTLVWFQSEDGVKGINRPASILSTLLGEKQEERTVEAFDSADDFDREWKRLSGGM